MENKREVNFKRVLFDLARYLISLLLLSFIFFRIQLSWEVLFFALIACFLQFKKLEIPHFGGQVYHWFLWSLLYTSNLSNTVVTFFISFFFRKGLNLTKWRQYFDQFINVFLPLSFSGSLYFYFSSHFEAPLFRFLLFLLFSQLFWASWFFLDNIGENLAFKTLYSFKTISIRSLAGAALSSLFALTTNFVGVGGAISILLLLYLTCMLYIDMKEKEEVFESNLELISLIEEKLLHQPEQTKRVIEEAINLGQGLHLSKAELKDLKKAALFHNVGMLKVASFVNREGRLGEKDFELLKEHTKVLENFCEHKPWLNFVLFHHEHFDGTGYPKGMIGESIPLSARILALVQAFVALTSPRPYREALLKEDALEELKRGEGTKYDAVLLRTYIRFKREKGTSEKDS